MSDNNRSFLQPGIRHSRSHHHPPEVLLPILQMRRLGLRDISNRLIGDSLNLNPGLLDFNSHVPNCYILHAQPHCGTAASLHAALA